MTKTMNLKEISTGAKEVIPLGVGAAIYGMAFGLLATQAYFEELQVGIMGSFVFAGAAQIVAVERLIAGAGATIAIVAGLAINLRLLLVTASIRDVFHGRPWWQIALGVHLTVDENWALLLSKRAERRNIGFNYLVGAGATVLFMWVSSTIVGAMVASSIPEPKSIGMDFAFVAAFIAMGRSLWRGQSDVVPWLTTFIVVGSCTLIFNIDTSWALIAGGLFGALAAGLAHEQ